MKKRALWSKSVLLFLLEIKIYSIKDMRIKDINRLTKKTNMVFSITIEK